MFRSRRKLLIAVAAGIFLAGLGYRIAVLAEEGGDDEAPAGPPSVINVAPRVGLPVDYPADDVQMFGRTVSIWDEQQFRVIKYQGDFRLDFARRRMSADDAVIWIRSEQHNGHVAKHFTIYLEGNVRIWDVGGTMVSAPRQIVTMESTGRVWTDSNVRGEPAADNTPFYRRAKLFRDRAAATTMPDETISDDEPVVAQPAAVPPVPVRYRADRNSPMVRGEERIIVVSGNVYLSRGEGQATSLSSLFMEISAERGVLYAREAKLREGAGAEETIIGAYLEGAVVIRQGPRQIRSSRLYYDFEHERALILDAVVFDVLPERNVPIMMRADRIRQLSGSYTASDRRPEGEFLMRNVRVTTSEMHTPQYALRANELYLRTIERDDGYNRLHYKTKHEFFELRGVPVGYLPGSQGTLDEQDWPIEQVRAGFDSKFGAFGLVRWNLFKLLNVERWDGVEASMTTAAYGKRGVSVSAETEYRRDDFFGLGLIHGMIDRGRTELGPNRELEEEQADEERSGFRGRGRFLWRHRQFLGDGWEWTGEFSWLSDRSFLEEWYEREFDTGKEQETLFYLKKAWNNNAFTVLLKPRINSFLNQVEKFPEIKYFKLGESLWDDRLVFFSENSAALLNYAADDERLDRKSSGAVGRLDLRQEVQAPVQAGPAKLVPYLSFRLTQWTKGSSSILTGNPSVFGEELDDEHHEEESSGGGLRAMITGGVNASTTFSRIFNNVESPFWDLHRLRHVIQPMFNLHLAASSKDRSDLLPFDPVVEGAHAAGAVNFGLYQRLQTKRGGPGNWRNVDWMRLDLDFTLFFNDPTRTWFEPEATRPPRDLLAHLDDVFIRGEYFYYRPENSLARSTMNWNYEWRISDTFTLMSDGNIGSDGVDRANFGVAIQRVPRWRMYFGNRYIRAFDTNQLLFQSHYKINRKYDFLFSYSFDTIRGEMASTQIALIRKFQRIYVAVSLDVSNIQERQMVMFSVWPEGIREFGFGDRSFSKVGTTTTSDKPW